MTFTSRALAAAFLLLSPAAGALTFVKSPDEQLVDRAPVIVRAVAQPLLREPVAEGLPMTYYALEVKAALRGAAVGEILMLEVPGGRNAAGEEAVVFGAPHLAPGEEALFFLARAAEGRLRVFGFHQGVFRLSPVDRRRAAWRDFAGADEVAIAGRPAEAERPRDLARFERFIAERLAGRRGPSDYSLAADAGTLEAATDAYTFYYNYDDGRPVRWPKGASPLSLTFFAHEAPQPGITGGGYGEVQAALAAWTGLPEGYLRLRYGGTTASAVGFHRRDGINSVVFDNFANARVDGEPFDCAEDSGVLANGLAWLTGITTFAGREFYTVVEGDVVINENVDCWSGMNVQSFLRILGHELGHTLALGHSCGDEGPCNTPAKVQSIMRSTIAEGSLGAYLSSDDQAGIAFLYGPPAAPAGLSAELGGGNRVFLRWEDGSDNENGFSIERERGGDREQVGFANANQISFDDRSAEGGATYRYLVRAVNDNGASAAIEATVTTAPLETPAQLTAVATGPESIALAWIDKAGNETGYEVWGRSVGEVLAGDELLATLPANSQTATIEGLIADSAYSFKVRAKGVPAGFTAFSNTATATTLPAAIEPCADGAGVTCLGAERFKVEVRWKDFEGQRGQALVAPAGSADSGIFYFFSPNNWEMLVKVLDGCAINQKHWVFAAATTDVETTLIVTDSLTGKTAVYWSPAGAPAPAITDIEAFAGCPESAAPKAAPVDVQGPQRTPTTPEAPTSFPRKRESSLSSPTFAAGCDGAPGNLCLQGGRYDVAVTWTDFAGVSGSGKAVPAGTADSGLFTFFSPNNWEMLVKVLDGCAINGKVWVFAAATTNVAYTLTVTDSETGIAKTYENPLGQASAAITDIVAFSSCSGS